MSDIRWIKLTTDMFENRKIKYLRRLPEGDSIVLIWVMLLTMAGRCNAGGMIFLTENIPYDSKMLADELGFEENTVKLAIQSLERLGMISSTNYLQITNWEEYQNIEGMERVREQNRLRKQAQRDREKALLRDGHVTVTESHATEKEEEIRKKNKNNIFTPPTVSEVKAYCQIRNNGINPEAFVDYYESKGWMIGKNKMKDWKAAVRTWEQRATPEEKSGKKTFDTSELDALINKF